VTPASDGLASWYTPGLVDGFGDRLLMFDNTETDSLELLRFYPSLVTMTGFEEALHERVRQVGRIPDHAFPLVVAVERLEGDGALALVSTHTPGKRLSTFFDKPGPRRGLNPAFVTGIVTKVIHALTVLQSKGDDITHSALTPDRVVVSTGGRICVVEHVLGLSLRRLNLSASQLWREFGLVSAPTPTGAVVLDARTDVFQLGVLALELLLGRRLSPLELKDRLPDLLDRWSEAARRAGLASDRLRLWLERALQFGNQTYATAAAAYADLRDMPSESTASAFDSLPVASVGFIGKRFLQPARLIAGEDSPMASFPMEDGSAPEDLPLVTPAPTPPPASTPPEALTAASPTPAALTPVALTPLTPVAPTPESPAQTAWAALLPAEGRWADVFAPETPAPPRPRAAAPVEAAPPAPTPPAVTKPVATKPAVSKAATPPPTPKTSMGWSKRVLKARVSPRVAAAVLGVAALAEGGVITALLLRQPTSTPNSTTGGSPVLNAGLQPSTPTPAAPAAPPPPVTVTTQAPVTTPSPVGPQAPAVDPIKAAANNQKSGGVLLRAPVELNVLQGDKVLGNTAAGPIVATAGTYQLDLINTAFGIKMRQAVTFRAGEITRLDVVIPQGRISLNAQPWANASIDGKAIGETPLANVSVPVGEHEVIFRHPELGERRMTVTVRADQPARASVTFER
jgi:hypothetical protein